MGHFPLNHQYSFSTRFKTFQILYHRAHEAIFWSYISRAWGSYQRADLCDFSTFHLSSFCWAYILSVIVAVKIVWCVEPLFGEIEITAKSH